MLKSLALQLLLVPGADALFTPFARENGVVFMLHRFRAPGYSPCGHDPGALRRALSYLRRKRYHLLSLQELVRLAVEGRPVPTRSVAFTIDDGYVDHAEIAGPIFAEFECPVTTFVATGFLDGTLWFWWDHIEFVFASTRRRHVRVVLGEQVLNYAWESPASRVVAQLDFTARCKAVPNEQKLTAIAQLARAAEVDIPERPPAQYAPMTWDQLRACEQRGMSFGPHTVTHPVLSRVSDEQSMWEICESWRRLNAEAQNPVPIFCYPNGRDADFTEREITTLQQLGFLGGVVGSEGFVNAHVLRRTPRAQYTAQRFPFPDDLSHLVQWASGAERMKFLLRRTLA